MNATTQTHITAAIRALAGIRGVSVLNDVLPAVGMAKSTYYNRREADNWSAGEVLQFAAYFGVSVELLYNDPSDLLGGVKTSSTWSPFHGESLALTA